MSRQSNNLRIINQNGLSIGGGNFVSNATAARLQQFPNATGNAVLNAAPATLTGKTISDTTSNVSARALLNSGTVVNLNASGVPSAGSVLQAGSGTAATWLPYQPIAGAAVVSSNVTSAAASTAGQSIPIVDNSVVYVRTTASGKYTTGTPNCASFVLVSSYRRTGGTLVRIGAQDDYLTISDATGSLNVATSSTAVANNVSVMLLNTRTADTVMWKIGSEIVSV